MKKLIFIIVIFVALVGVVGGLALFSSSKDKISGNSVFSNENLVPNKPLVDKMEALYKINLQRDLTPEDLAGVKELVKGDAYTQEEFEELSYLVEKNENAHASHIITAISVYASTGQKFYCMPHEISHIRTYIKYGDEERVFDSLKEASENLKDWQDYVRERHKTEQTYFKNFKEINAKIIDALKKLNSGDRSKELVSELYYIEQYGVC